VGELSIGRFRALFLTGTSAKVLPIRSVEGLSFDVNHPLVRRLMASYDRLIESHLSDAASSDTGESGEGSPVQEKGVR
jgi:hypothetical protein